MEQSALAYINVVVFQNLYGGAEGYHKNPVRITVFWTKI
jgi:hypothetical protein